MHILAAAGSDVHAGDPCSPGRARHTRLRAYGARPQAPLTRMRSVAQTRRGPCRRCSRDPASARRHGLLACGRSYDEQGEARCHQGLPGEAGAAEEPELRLDGRVCAQVASVLQGWLDFVDLSAARGVCQMCLCVEYAYIYMRCACMHARTRTGRGCVCMTGMDQRKIQRLSLSLSLSLSLYIYIYIYIYIYDIA